MEPVLSSRLYAELSARIRYYEQDAEQVRRRRQGVFRYRWLDGKRWREQFESGDWPPRTVMRVHVIADPWDPTAEYALRAILECGHRPVLRGADRFRAQVPCLKCAGERL